MAMDSRWDALDMSDLERIRKFESEQPEATDAIARRPVDMLRMTQALLLNGTTRALARPERGKEHETPLFFCRTRSSTISDRRN